MKFKLVFILYLSFLALSSWAGKQKIIVRLREPLRAEAVKIRLPEITNYRGETRDLETKLDLGVQVKTEGPKVQSTTLKLDMVLRSVGTNAVQVLLTLPDAGFVEVVMMDFYGKSLATVFSGNLAAGPYNIRPYALKEGDNNGIKFMTLRINGKMVMKKVITKVR